MRVAILADDLIWSTRLRDLVVGCRCRAATVRPRTRSFTALPRRRRGVVDLTARAYDGIAAIESARAARRSSSPSDSTTTSRGAGGPARRRRPARVSRRFDDGLALMTTLASREPSSRPRDGRGLVDPADRYRQRLAPPRRESAGAGLEAILVGVGPDLRYLTGYPAMPLERLTMLVVIPAQGDLALVVPRLEATPASSCPRPPGVYRRHLGRRRRRVRPGGRMVHDAWPDRADRCRRAASLSRTTCGAPSPPIQEARVAGAVRARIPDLRELRIVKDRDEIEPLRRAARRRPGRGRDRRRRLVGRTEEDVAHEVRERLVAEGHDEATFAIVGSGPNSASPHHEASDRVIQAGEPIVLDIGGTIDGYGSDITRTLWVTGGDAAQGPDERFRHLFGVLHAPRLRRHAPFGRASRPRRWTRRRGARSRRKAMATLLPPDRPRHRPRRPRGPLHHRRQPGASSRGDGLQHRARIYLVANTAPGSRTSSSAVPDGPIPLNEAPRELLRRRRLSRRLSRPVSRLLRAADTAVDVEAAAEHEPRLVRGEIQGRESDILGPTELRRSAGAS